MLHGDCGRLKRMARGATEAFIGKHVDYDPLIKADMVLSVGVVMARSPGRSGDYAMFRHRLSTIAPQAASGVKA